MTETLLAFFKALADESRLRIVGLLANGERSVQDLAAQLGLKEPTVSHHLAILKAQGLVTVRAEGATRWHALDASALERLVKQVLVKPLEAPVRPPPADEPEARVLAAFLDQDERLKEIPANRRKRVVILKWLARMFEMDRFYKEAEINACLKTRHPDFATLRRELVGHRMLGRDDGVYWRLHEAQWRVEEPC
jgi:DNA-binding transcriptional ArsR family regulator